MLKRFVVAAAAVALVGGVSMGAAGAVDEHAPHGGPGSHPHHIHTGNGECHDYKVDMEGGNRGLHGSSNNAGPDHGMWHGRCATHNNHG